MVLRQQLTDELTGLGADAPGRHDTQRPNLALDKLLVREGAVVDASVVESQRRPRKVIDVMPEDRSEELHGDRPVIISCASTPSAHQSVCRPPVPA